MKGLIKAARGETLADIVLKNGKVINVFDGTIEEADVAVLGGKICGVGHGYSGRQEYDCTGKYIMSGFIDTHLHIESSMLSPVEFAKAVIPYGTTTIIADPHEIANVCGMDGVNYMIDELKRVPINARIMLPSCVPATFFESSGATLDSECIKDNISRPDLFGLGEFMNYVGVIDCADECLSKIAAASDAGKITDGHSIGLAGKDLCAYASTGIRTEHECVDVSSMLEKIKRGIYIQIREGCAAKNVAALIRGVNDRNMRRCLFCTDDKHVDDLLMHGHLNQNLKRAVENGLDPVSAVTIATLNAAECYGLREEGAICPGYKADIVVCPDLVNFAPEMVFFNGKLVAKNNKLLIDVPPVLNKRVQNSVRIKPVMPDDFEIYSDSDEVNVIKLIYQNVVTEKETAIVKREGKRVLTEGAGLLRLAVVERHKATGNIGKALLKNYGLKGGAIAETVAHDSHNIIVLGDNTSDMAVAVGEIERIGGGITVVSGGKVIGSLPLEIGGLMTSLPIREVYERFTKLCESAHSLGVSRDVEPFMTLSFLALPVIPYIKLTDKGLFDVAAFKFITIEA